MTTNSQSPIVNPCGARDVPYVYSVEEGKVMMKNMFWFLLRLNYFPVSVLSLHSAKHVAFKRQFGASL